MLSLITVAKAQEKIAENVRLQRLQIGLTQQGLAERSGVALPNLRKFEQKIKGSGLLYNKLNTCYTIDPTPLSFKYYAFCSKSW